MTAKKRPPAPHDELLAEMDEARKCIKLLTKTVRDILPQIGGIVLQDYAALNEGLMLSSKILKGE